MEDQKYTVVYVEKKLSCNVVRQKRISTLGDEPLVKALIRHDLLDSAVFIYHGWPKLEGE